MRRPEQELHITVAHYLERALPEEVFFFHCPNGGARRKVEAAILKAMGVKAGFPDIGIIWTGRIYLIELKARETRTRLTMAQLNVHQQMRMAGAKVQTCYCLADVQTQLLAWGFPLKWKMAVQGEAAA